MNFIYKIDRPPILAACQPILVAGVRNVFYLRFFSAIWSVSLIINKPIEHILQGLILGHNAHNTA